MRRPHAELLGERPFPEQLAVARQRHQQAVAAEGEDIAARGIDDRRRPGDAVRRHVAREDVVAVLPEQLARVGVEAHQAFLHQLAFARRGLQIETIAKDRRVRSVRRRAPSTPGSDPTATTRTAGRSRSRCPFRAGPRQSGQSAPRGARPRGSTTASPTSGRRGSVAFISVSRISRMVWGHSTGRPRGQSQLSVPAWSPGEAFQVTAARGAAYNLLSTLPAPHSVSPQSRGVSMRDVRA